MKPARIIVICVAAVAAIGLALVVRAMGSTSQSPTAAAAAAVPARPMAKVLVAAKDLQPGQRLTEADLAWKDWPVDEVNPAFITDGTTPLPSAEAAAGAPPAAAAVAPPEGAVASVTRAANNLTTGGAKADYIGSVVREPILAGEPIVSRKIVRAGDSGYMAAYLEPGMRAMAIRVTVETAAGGFILPNDHVDVVFTPRDKNADKASDSSNNTSEIILSNIRVLAIDQSVEEKNGQKVVVGKTATLELTPAQVETLTQAQQSGTLSLALRSITDASKDEAPPEKSKSGVNIVRFGVGTMTAPR